MCPRLQGNRLGWLLGDHKTHHFTARIDTPGPCLLLDTVADPRLASCQSMSSVNTPSARVPAGKLLAPPPTLRQLQNSRALGQDINLPAWPWKTAQPTAGGQARPARHRAQGKEGESQFISWAPLHKELFQKSVLTLTKYFKHI